MIPRAIEQVIDQYLLSCHSCRHVANCPIDDVVSAFKIAVHSGDRYGILMWGAELQGAVFIVGGNCGLRKVQGPIMTAIQSMIGLAAGSPRSPASASLDAPQARPKST